MSSAAKNTDRLPLMAIKVPDHESLNAGLKKYLLELSQTRENQQSNHASGRSYFKNKWISPSDLHTCGQKDITALASFAEHTANRMVRFPDKRLVLSIYTMWCIISQTGLSGSRHNHAGRVSGAYYVDAGSSGPTDGGLIQFYQNPGSPQPSHQLVPEAGQLLLFSSALEHSVSTYTGTDPRIVISLNLK